MADLPDPLRGGRRLPRAPSARRLATLLAPWRDQLAFTGITCQGSVARPLGLAFATVGGLDEADEAFAQAVAIHERVDAPIELARTQVDWARMLAARDQPGDPDERAHSSTLPSPQPATSAWPQSNARGQTLLAKLATK